MAKQTQGSMLLVGLIAGGAGFVAFLAMLVVGGMTFSPALFLSILIAAVVAVVLFFAFHRGPAEALTPERLRPRDEFQVPASGGRRSDATSGGSAAGAAGLPPQPLPADGLAREGSAAYGRDGEAPATVPGSPGYDERLEAARKPEALVPGATHDPNELAMGMDTDPSTKPTSVARPADGEAVDNTSEEQREGAGVAPGSAGVDAGTAGADDATRAATARTSIEGGMATANATPGGGGIAATGTGSTDASDADRGTASDSGPASERDVSGDHDAGARPGSGVETGGAGATGGAAMDEASAGGPKAYGAMSGTAVADDDSSTRDTSASDSADGSEPGKDLPGAGSTGDAAESTSDDTATTDAPEDRAASDQATDVSDETAEAGPSVIGVRPESLDAPRDGGADDLKRIKGVGPKLEEMLNGMGYYHYDQIAAWTDHEVAWVDEHLEGFKGRVTRDNWVSQADTLAKGGTTEFSDRADKGEVYD